MGYSFICLSLGMSELTPEKNRASAFPSPGDLPDPGIQCRSSTLQVDSFLGKPPGSFPGNGEVLVKGYRLLVIRQISCGDLMFRMGFPGGSVVKNMQMTRPLWQKVKRN